MAFPFIPLLAALGPVIGAGVQSIANRRNSRIQNQYNEPQRQMERFRKAGLNPNLMYTMGNSGNMTPITPTNWQDAIGGAGQRYAQSELTQTQADVGEQKITESQAKIALHEAQTDLVRANPFLNEQYITSLIGITVDNARLKRQEANYYLTEQTYGGISTRGEQKMQLDIEMMAEKLGLTKVQTGNAEQDKKIKAEIVQSEAFKKELLEVQRNWLKSGDMTPQHFFQGLMLLFTKML